jgi:trk system potassium uptake protein TrkA
MMRLVIVGAGKTGTYLAENLREECEVVVVDQRKDRIARIGERMPELTLVLGDACEPSVLEHAEVSRADMVVAVTGHDEDNLVVSWLAKSRGGVGVVAARVNHPRNAWLFSARWGVDVALSPAAAALDVVRTRVRAVKT